jgi:alkylhydroperoxidase family enzyme
MGLCQWNIWLESAVLRDMALFEVALRNACDRCLSMRLSGDGGAPWRTLVGRYPRNIVEHYI